MKIPGFEELYLVGGTSLALQLGHRISVDIDLFGKTELSEFELNDVIQNLGSVTLLNKSKNIKIYTINGIKVDIVNYPYKWIDTTLNIEGIRLAGKKDIAAMKLNAIAGRGSKKDFADLYFLLNEFTLAEMIKFYKEKYPEASEFLVLKSLTWFDDADLEPEINWIIKQNWTDIKQSIIKTTSEYLNHL
ncbi:MAG: nucleotidyl transferase AbiEii/AbiGii toxin family protein [Sphingobacteriaceae bacterium]|nr:nucleotidyl transferase AbiEii/AbiGii toxin family protein [Sphingobacteriaceae bacterium]